jgi:hypothetical protein
MDQPIPVRADRGLLQERARRSFNRACAALVMATGGGEKPLSIVKGSWEDDLAVRIVKAATNASKTTDYPAVAATQFLEMLSPAAASTRLLNLGNKLSLDGVSTIKLPFIAGSGRPAAPLFVGESLPAPVVNMSTSGMTLGPTTKILVQAVVTNELQAASADNAERIVSEALAISCTQSLDAKLFSSDAAVSGVSPAGLLHGVAPITSTAGTGAEGIANDLAALADQIAKAGIDTSGLAFIMSAKLAVKIETLAGPKFAHEILSSGYVPDGQIVAVAPKALASGYGGVVEVTTATDTAVHMESTTPQDIGTPGAPPVVAAPVLSAWQSGLIVIRVRARAAWCIQTGGVSVLTGATW